MVEPIQTPNNYGLLRETDPVLDEYMKLLDYWNPNDKRSPEAFVDSLGLFLMRAGLDVRILTKMLFERISLQSNRMLVDLHLERPYLIRDLVSVVGDFQTAEFYSTIESVFSNEFRTARVKGKKDWFNQPYPAIAMGSTRYLEDTFEVRKEIFNTAYKIQIENPVTPMEWLTVFLEVTPLKTIIVPF